MMEQKEQTVNPLIREGSQPVMNSGQQFLQNLENRHADVAATSIRFAREFERMNDDERAEAIMILDTKLELLLADYRALGENRKQDLPAEIRYEMLQIGIAELDPEDEDYFSIYQLYVATTLKICRKALERWKLLVGINPPEESEVKLMWELMMDEALVDARITLRRKKLIKNDEDLVMYDYPEVDIKLEDEDTPEIVAEEEEFDGG